MLVVHIFFDWLTLFKKVNNEPPKTERTDKKASLGAKCKEGKYHFTLMTKLPIFPKL